jgi:hypothetical protein
MNWGLSVLDEMFPSFKKRESWEHILAARQPGLYRLLNYESPALGYADTVQIETKLAPYDVMTRSGAYLRTYRYAGPDRTTDSLEARARFNAVLNGIFNDFEEGWCVQVTLDRCPCNYYPEADYPDRASWLVGEERRREFEQYRYYESVTYITLVYKELPAARKRKVQTYIDTNALTETLDIAYATFQAKCDQFFQAFSMHFDVEPLGIRSVDSPHGPVEIDDQLSLYTGSSAASSKTYSPSTTKSTSRSTSVRQR